MRHALPNEWLEGGGWCLKRVSWLTLTQLEAKTGREAWDGRDGVDEKVPERPQVSEETGNWGRSAELGTHLEVAGGGRGEAWREAEGEWQTGRLQGISDPDSEDLAHALAI